MLCVRSLFLLHLYFCVCILFSDSVLYLLKKKFSLSWMYNITHKRWMQRCFKNTVCWKCWLLFGCMFGAVTVCGSHKTPKPFWSRATFYFFSLSISSSFIFVAVSFAGVCVFMLYWFCERLSLWLCISLFSSFLPHYTLRMILNSFA